MLSTSPPRTYEDLAFLKTKYKQISFDRNDYGIVKMQAALNCLLDFVGGTFIVWERKYVNYFASSNYKTLSMESSFGLNSKKLIAGSS